MRYVVALLLAACGGMPGAITDDAGRVIGDPHALVTTCETGWTTSGVPPAQCESACQLRPIPLPCADPTRPCVDHTLACNGARNPALPSMDCAAGAFHVGSVTGCCIVQPGVPKDSGSIPRFYACP